MREEYEAWFIGKFGFPPMPIHSRVLDFCWEGYQAGRKQGYTAIEIRMNDIKQERDQLRQHVTLLRAVMNRIAFSRTGQCTDLAQELFAREEWAEEALDATKEQ